MPFHATLIFGAVQKLGAYMFGRTRGLQGGGSGLNSRGALLALQKHLKHDPNDYTALPLQSPFSRIHWGMERSVYFAVVIHVHTAALEEGGAPADCKDCGGGGE